MRVVHFNAAQVYGGIESWLVTLARYREAAPQMQPIFAVCFPGRFVDELRAASAEVHVLGPANFSRPWTIFRVQSRWKKVLRETGAEMVVTHGCWQHAVAARSARNLGRKVVFYHHGMVTGKHWLDRLSRRTFPDGAVCTSREVQSNLSLLFPGIASKVIYCAVADRTPTDRQEARIRIRREFDTPQDAVVIVMASRMEAWKGQRLLLEALRLLKNQPEVVAWIVGGAQQPEEVALLADLRHAASEAGLAERVRFIGQRSDVPDIFAAADIHCQPNLGAEPFGLVFVEALYAGLPVVTTAMGGPLEIVDDTCGILTPPGDAVALAGALQGLISDPESRRKLSAGGPQRAAVLCDPVQQMGRLSDYLHEVASS